MFYNQILFIMKLFVYVCFFCFFLFSCKISKVIKLSNNQEVTLKSNIIGFKILKNRILLQDGSNFILDIGAPNVILAEKKSFYYPKIIDSIEIGNLTKFDGEKIENKIIVFDSIESDLFKIKNAIFRVVDNPIDDCIDFNGLLGSETFVDQKIHLNFQNNYISKVDEKFINENLKEYASVNVTDFDGYYYNIEISVDNKKIDAILDTGNPFDIILSFEDFKKHTSNDSFKKSLYYTKSKDSFYVSSSKLNLLSYSDTYFTRTKTNLKRNILGIGFMKNYNWILDYKNGKVYVQKFKYNELNPKPDMSVNIKDNFLYVSSGKNLSPFIVHLGDKIVSVKSEIIRPDNICYYRDLLNTTENWDLLNIQFEK